MIRPFIIASLLGVAPAALAQGTITFFWDINDTGQDTYLYAGETSINFKLYALMEPEQFSFAESIYEIRGGSEFGSAGVVTNYDNKLDQNSDEGELQPNNDILDIDSFQFPELFGYQHDRSNPILLYELDWQVTSFFTEATLTSADHQGNWVYTDQYGTVLTYEPITTTATVIIPAPATAALPLATAAMAMRRSRGAGAGQTRPSAGHNWPDEQAACSLSAHRPRGSRGT